ncbi:MAG: cytochrome b/b6 domain-containing protein [Acidimicrobiales bacterium]
MAATTPPSTSPPAETKASPPLSRFDGLERAVHWINAGLFLILILTGAALYFEPLMALVGRRALMERIHIDAGLALPVPIVFALAGSWGKRMRADLRRFNRWTEDDGMWLRVTFRGRAERAAARVNLKEGKFNAGQKLNAAFTGGAILVMLGTGAIMRWFHPFPLSWRTGATFVHNWLFVAIVVVIVGHVAFALSDRDALGSMFTGRISDDWARRRAPGWWQELHPARSGGSESSK